jgi:hypothetical protein
MSVRVLLKSSEWVANFTSHFGCASLAAGYASNSIATQFDARVEQVQGLRTLLVFCEKKFTMQA